MKRRFKKGDVLNVKLGRASFGVCEDANCPVCHKCFLCDGGVHPWPYSEGQPELAMSVGAAMINGEHVFVICKECFTRADTVEVCGAVARKWVGNPRMTFDEVRITSNTARAH